MANKEEFNVSEFRAIYNNIAKKTDFSNLDPNVEFESLPEGYYLSELEDFEFGQSQNSGNYRIKLTFKVTDGYTIEENEEKDEITFKKYNKANGKIWVYFPIKEENDITKFSRNMLKFESEPGVSILEKDVFEDFDTIFDGLDILKGSKIYIQVTKTKKDNGEVSTWNNLISWKRASQLGLPE